MSRRGGGGKQNRERGRRRRSARRHAAARRHLPGGRRGRRRVPAEFLRPAQGRFAVQPVPAVGRGLAVRRPRAARSGPELASNDGFQLTCVDANMSAQGVRRGLLAGSGGGDALRGRLAVHRGGRLRGQPVLLAALPQRRRLPAARRAASSTRHRALADTRRAMIGMCTPESKIAGTVCVREAMCPAGQGCVLYGGRTSLQDLPRRRHQVGRHGVRGGLRVPQRRMLRPRLSTSAAARTAPTARAPAQVNSDCGARSALRPAGRRQQRLARRSARRPGRRLLPDAVRADRRRRRCTSDASCVARQDGSDTCDVAHGLCYRKAAAPGSACSSASRLPAGRRVQHRARASRAATARRSAAIRPRRRA